MEAVDYFARTLQLSAQLDTSHFLAMADILPELRDRAVTLAGQEPPFLYYAADAVQRALQTFSGGRVELLCTAADNDVLAEVRYVFHVAGSLQTGELVPAPPVVAEAGEKAGPQDDAVPSDLATCPRLVRYVAARGRPSPVGEGRGGRRESLSGFLVAHLRHNSQRSHRRWWAGS